MLATFISVRNYEIMSKQEARGEWGENSGACSLASFVARGSCEKQPCSMNRRGRLLGIFQGKPSQERATRRLLAALAAPHSCILPLTQTCEHVILKLWQPLCDHEEEAKKQRYPEACCCPLLRGSHKITKCLYLVNPFCLSLPLLATKAFPALQVLATYPGLTSRTQRPLAPTTSKESGDLAAIGLSPGSQAPFTHTHQCLLCLGFSSSPGIFWSAGGGAGKPCPRHAFFPSFFPHFLSVLPGLSVLDF